MRKVAVTCDVPGCEERWFDDGSARSVIYFDGHGYDACEWHYDFWMKMVERQYGEAGEIEERHRSEVAEFLGLNDGA